MARNPPTGLAWKSRLVGLGLPKILEVPHWHPRGGTGSLASEQDFQKTMLGEENPEPLPREKPACGWGREVRSLLCASQTFHFTALFTRAVLLCAFPGDGPLWFHRQGQVGAELQVGPSLPCVLTLTQLGWGAGGCQAIEEANKADRSQPRKREAWRH